MNTLLFFAIFYATLYLSCSSTTESCPTRHKTSKLAIHTHVIMYEHGIEYCGIEENIYGTNKYMIQEWIKDHPTKSIYHTIWGAFRIESLHKIYNIHLLLGVFVLVFWEIIMDEKHRMRRRHVG